MSSSPPGNYTAESGRRILFLTAMKCLEDFLTEVIGEAVDEALKADRKLLDRPLVYTVAQTAQILQVSRRKVEMWVADGALPRLPHTPGKILIPRIAVEAFVDSAVRQDAAD